MDIQEALKLLRESLGNPGASFRPHQWEAIDDLVTRGKRLLVVERTGWGKSVVYFIATKAIRASGGGPTLIVSPLLALMRNQIEAAEQLGLHPQKIDSTNPDDWSQIRKLILNNEADLLLISPERLANENFVEHVLEPVAEAIGLLVIDEAHCISDWGHDFRPDYRRITTTLRLLPRGVPILCTTATANDRVVQDVQEQVGNLEAYRGTLVRESLSLQAIRLSDQPARMAWLAENIPRLPGTGIVYALTKRDTERLAGWLSHMGIDAAAYHGDLENTERIELESRLSGNQIKVLVATTALGMGYDKPDLGFVVHYQAPGSVVQYYQQVGRAGRAIAHAYGILLSGREDARIQEYFRRTAFPEERDIDAILKVLRNSDGMTVRQLERSVNLKNGLIEKVLKLISVENPAPVSRIEGRWYATPVPFSFDRERIQFLIGQREEEWAEVQSYLDSGACLMRFLQDALDDPSSDDCGRCANCTPVLMLPEVSSEELAEEAAKYLKRTEIPLVVPKQVALGSFPIYGWVGNFPKNLQASEGRILCFWDDAGWGHRVTQGINNNSFDARLVSAVVEMIRRWAPDPLPGWVTCVPSSGARGSLVPEFAEKVARQLGIPFRNAVKQVRENEPQKVQQNRWNQCNNLDGVFSVTGPISSGPVLLLDDVVDSGWTLAVVSRLLLDEATVEKVYPVTLASMYSR